MAARGFKGHVATRRQKLEWGACGWSMVQVDYDEELVPLHAILGTMDAEIEVQRAIKRAELTAFLCLLKKIIENAKMHVDNKGIIDGLLRREMRCIGPKARDADLWLKKKRKNCTAEIQVK